MNKQYWKRLVKLYQSENNALADEAIKYKKSAETAEEEIVRLKCEIGKLRYVGDKLIGIGNDFEFLANDCEISKRWYSTRIEWQKAKEM